MEKRDQPLKVGDWLVEPKLNRISQDDRQVSLRPQVMDLLVYLAQNRGEVLTADQLLDEVWQGVIVGSGSVYNCINELRHAFGDDPRNATHLETIPRRGYRLIAPVEFLKQEEADHAGTENHENTNLADALHRPAAATGAGPKSRLLSPGTWAIIAVLMLAGPYIALKWPHMDTASPGGDAIESLAVLPLQDFTANPEEYWSDGITAALITELSKIESLRVISHTSVMRYRRRTESLPDIARQLGVDAILDGSITRDGERLAVKASLVRARNERTLWSANYEESLRDVLQLHRTIAMEVTNQVDAIVSTASGEIPRMARAVDPEAYEAMIRGEFFLGRNDSARGFEQLRRAVEIDRGFALGWATLSEAYLSAAIDDPTWVAPAKAAAERALALDPDLPAARTVLAGIAFYFEWDWERAEQELKETLRLNPGFDNAHQVYGDYLEFLGDWDQSIAEGIRSTRVNPDSVSMLLNLGITYIFARRYEDAQRTCTKALERAPGSSFAHRCMAEALAGQGDLEAGLEYLEKAVSLAPNDQPLMAQQAIFYMASKQEQRARAVAQRLEEMRAAGDYVSPLILAMVYMALAETDAALDWFEIAVEEKAPWTPGIHAWPYFDPLRGETRFEALIRRIGLPAANPD